MTTLTCPEVTTRKKKYLSTPMSGDGKMSEQQQAYLAGNPLQPRISIE